MELIGITELLAAAGLFTVGAFFKPLFLVFRDWTVWWLVERFILTDKLVRAVRKREAARKALINSYSFSTSEKVVGGQRIYEINGIEVSEKKYQDYSQDKQRLEETFALRDDFIHQRTIFADKVTQHFSQHPKNPVLALCEAIQQSLANEHTPKHTVHLTGEPSNAQAESQAVSEVLRRAAKSSQHRK